MTKRALLAAAVLTAFLLISFLLVGPAPNEREFAQEFYFRHSEDLRRLVSAARLLPRGARIEPSQVTVPKECSANSRCRSAAYATQATLKKIRAHVIVVNESCSEGSRCSVSILIQRKGIGVSGSGTELIYDTSPDWGHFQIYPIPGAPTHWYYRHLGD